MNPLDRIQSYYEEFTATDRELAIYFINNPHTLVTKTADFISKETKTSKAAISRFCKKIGYSGYSEFRYDLSRFLVGHNSELDLETTYSNSIEAITSIYSSYVAQINQYIDDSTMTKLAKDFLNAKYVKVVGINRSYNSANQLKLRLLRMGYDSEAISDEQTIGDTLNIMNKDYFILVFTTTDNTRLYSQLLKGLEKNGGKLVVVTMNRNLPIQKECDYYITLPRISKDSSMSFLDDQPIFMIFIEILLNYIARTTNN